MVNFQIIMRVYFNPSYYNSAKVVELYQKNKYDVDVMFHRDCYMILGKCEIDELEKIKEIFIKEFGKLHIKTEYVLIN